MRLSFRLDEDSADVWEKLRKRHEGRKDSYIFREVLRQEDFRLKGNTKDDRLNEIKALLTEINKHQALTVELVLILFQHLKISTEAIDNAPDH